MRAAEKGNVYLVGAGPGNPDLLTMRAVHLLETADVILHDDLVSHEVLAMAHPQATVTSVGKRHGQPKTTQAAIHELMITSARSGQSVVRLKSGDPLVFGRAAEEMTALREACIPFEIVPGVTAAMAAAAVLEVPLTDRTSASRLLICSGCHAADKEEDDDAIWSGFLPPDVTLAIYMPGRDLARTAQELAAMGVNANTPCCAVSNISTSRQSYAVCRLGDLAILACGPTPLLLLIGRTMEGLVFGEEALRKEPLA